MSEHVTDPRWRGLSALVRDLVVHGSEAVETIQRETLRRPIAVITAIAPTTTSAAKTIEWVHGAAIATTHWSIRVVAKVVDRSIALGLDVYESRRRPR
jgi:hypothetical protein